MDGSASGNGDVPVSSADYPTDPSPGPITRIALESVARISPNLAYVKPLRSALLTRLRNQIQSGRLQRPPVPTPPGVRDDRMIMGLALIDTFERALDEGRISRISMQKGASYIIESWLWGKGDAAAMQRFRGQYGTLPPNFLVISPGKGCNLQCVGCYADSGPTPEKMDWNVFDRIITECKTLWGKRSFVISGGEPLAYRDHGKGLLDAAEKHGDCFFMFYTNGTLITDKVADRMAEMGNIVPAISVEGWRGRTDERRGRGVYDKVVDAMNRLRERHVLFGLSLTATRYNAEEIFSDQFMDYFFGELKALFGWVFHYMPIGRKYTMELMPSAEQRLWMWQRSWELMRDKGYFLADFWNHGTTCNGCISAGRFSGGGYLYIDWNGAVTPCVFVPYTPVNINQVYARGGTINDMWADPFFAGIREWQESYNHGNGHPGNLMAPCLIRDHHDVLRRLISVHEPEPTDPSAEEALLDPDYAQAMIDYGKAYQDLSGPIWEDVYLRQE